MNKIPDTKEPGSASFYGTEDTLDAVLSRYIVHPASSDFYVRTKEMFLERINSLAKDGDTVLDIGCSFGFVSSEIAKSYLEKGLSAKVIGIDIDPRQIMNAEKYAEQQGLENIEFRICDARSAAGIIGGRDFSLITSIYSFHHIPDSPGEDILTDKRKVLKTLHSLSGPGAHLVIGDVTVPVSYTRKDRYQKDVENKWMPQRIEAAKRVSEAAAIMEANASLGVTMRKNEYPLTINEFESLFPETGWCIESKDVIEPYGDVVFRCLRK